MPILESILDEVPTLLQGNEKTMEVVTPTVKRFNRDKVVKFGATEFDRFTKNTIWLRLSQP